MSASKCRRAARPAIIDPHQAYSVEETTAARGGGRTSTYEDIRTGRLKAFKRGRRTLILGAEIIRANNADANEAVGDDHG